MERLRDVAESYGVGQIDRHIFLCSDQTKPKCCTLEDGLASWNYLKRRLDELGLSRSGGGLSNQGKLSPDLRTRSDCSRLSGGCLVSFVYSGSPGGNHSGASDRRPGRQGLSHPRAISAGGERER